jgi:hypothetical protein
LIIIGLGAVAVWVNLLHPGSARTPQALYVIYSRYLYLALGCALLGVLLSIWVNRRQTSHAPQHALLVFATTWFVAITIAGNAHEIFGRHSSGALLAPAIRAELAKLPTNTPFYSVTVLDHTLPFYIRHTMIMVQNPDELRFGVQQEPTKWIPTLADWRNRWQKDRTALALLPPTLYERFVAEHLPMRVIARDARRVIVAKPWQ